MKKMLTLKLFLYGLMGILAMVWLAATVIAMVLLGPPA
jgi:hypothetical protein